jgi:hypothetical protein
MWIPSSVAETEAKEGGDAERDAEKEDSEILWVCIKFIMLLFHSTNDLNSNAPVETVLMFAQAVYLMFSAVYVCKETVEHLLLSAGGEEGHHHHRGDEDESLAGWVYHGLLLPAAG